MALAALGAVAATPLPTPSDRAVYDLAEVLPPDAEARLEARFAAVRARLGVSLVVLTVPRLVDETIDALAVRAGQAWGVGDAATDQGVVVALARDDRQVYVATGYGVEGELPDGKVGALLDREALPALAAGRPDEALDRLTAALADTLAAGRGITLDGAPGPRPTAPAPLELLAALAALAAAAWLVVRHPRAALALFVLFRGGGRRGHGGGAGGFGGGGFGGGGAGRKYQ